MIVPIRSRRSSRVAVAYGAVAADASPDEQDVLVQVDTVQQALTALGYTPVALPLTLDLEAARRRLLHLRPAFVYNLVESLEGADRLIHLAPALFESLGLPFTGPGSTAVHLTSNKPLAKRLLAAAGIATPPWIEGRRDGLPTPAFPGPYIVKSVWEHASIGIDDNSVVDDPAKLTGLLRRRQRRHGGDWFAERYIEGREFNLSLLGGAGDVELLPPAEMLFVDYPAGKRRIVDYAAKWHPDSFEFSHTPRRFQFGSDDAGLLAQLEATAKACWRLFDLRGSARVDCRVDENGRPWVLEVNINPCISPDAGFAAAAAEAGLTVTAAVGRIVADLPTAVVPSPWSLSRKRERGPSASHVLPGTLARVAGEGALHLSSLSRAAGEGGG